MLRYFCFFILFAVSFGQNAFCQKKANGNLQYKSAVVRIFGCCDDKVFSGTGFIVDFHGGIITNYHVIKDCVRLIVVVKYNENLACFYDANILKIDKLNDLAFLKANIKNQPRPFELSTSEPSVLDDVVAFGFPALLDRPIIGNNLYKNNYYILENLEPNITKGAISKISATRITHNAIITYGSSGGPLINARTGQVVGVNFEGKKDSFSTFYFAVPINFVKKILDAPDGTGMLSRIPAQSISTDKTIAKSIAETPHPRILSKTSRQSPGTYPWRLNITASIFWVGKDNQKCDDDCWNSTWKKDFGGFDNPDPVCRTRDFRPKTFIPRQNPFYVALPYNDVSRGEHKAEASRVIPWFRREYAGKGQSVCKGRWVQIVYNKRSCFAQWEDCGPFTTEDWPYVFGDKPPVNTQNKGAGIDISPAVRDYLGITGGTAIVHWRFVEFYRIPRGPWSKYGDNNPFVNAELGAGKKSLQLREDRLRQQQEAIQRELLKDPAKLRRELFPQ